MRRDDIRNIAIIAHVDHGKTTLVDGLLEATDLLESGHQDAFLDSNPLERERGITILAKNVSTHYKGTKINIIDTPGHADFGGEVERVLMMADGVLLLVDAAEGPMPQTTFVLSKALKLGLRPVVIVNKIDRPDARPEWVLSAVYDLFIDLGADDSLLEFPVVYASGKNRKAGPAPDQLENNLIPVLEAMIHNVPGPEVEPDKPLQVMITNFMFDNFVGRIGIGRIVAGTVADRAPVALIKRGSGGIKKAQVKELRVFEGLSQQRCESAQAGEIVAMVGLEGVDIGDTVADIENPRALPPIVIDEPTVTMVFMVNDSPLAGQEGDYVTSRQVADRLKKAAEADVALRLKPGASPEQHHVAGRGVLHLGILIENMRREGFEFAVGAPEVIVKEIDGVNCEPVEEAVVDLPSDLQGKAIELLSSSGGELVNVENHGVRSTLKFRIPSRGLMGMRTRLLSASRGEAIFTHRFDAYEAVRGDVARRSRGAIISTDTGQVTEYALQGLEDRGVFFVEPGERCYEGQVVGENNREDDIIANVTKMKALTNIRSANKEATVTLKAARDLSMEAALEWLAQDELLEVTPQNIRIRKRWLKGHERKRNGGKV